MAKKIKKISKTEQKLRNQLRYQRGERNKALNELRAHGESFKDSVKLSIKQKKLLGIYKDVISKKTYNNYILQYSVNHNKNIDAIEEKLYERFGKKKKYDKTSVKKQKGQRQWELGFAWQIDSNIDKQINRNSYVTHVNGYDKKKDFDKIFDEIQKAKFDKEMDAYMIMYLVGNNGKYTIVVQNADYKLTEI